MFPDAYGVRSYQSMISFGGVDTELRVHGGIWSTVAAITSITFVAGGGGTFGTNSVMSLEVVDELFRVAGAQTIVT